MVWRYGTPTYIDHAGLERLAALDVCPAPPAPRATDDLEPIGRACESYEKPRQLMSDAQIAALYAAHGRYGERPRA